MDTNSAITVLYFGDSITAGFNLPPEAVWPSLVEKASQGTFRAINEGLVIALGGNDARDISGNCVPNALKNIREMIALTRAARPGIPILLVGPTNINKDCLGPTKPIANERDQNLRDLNAAYEKLAWELSCYFVSLYGVIPPDSLAVDGVHPDAEGNRPLAAKMLDVLTKIDV